jgi:hypothetical protein
MTCHRQPLINAKKKAGKNNIKKIIDPYKIYITNTGTVDTGTYCTYGIYKGFSKTYIYMKCFTNSYLEIFKAAAVVLLQDFKTLFINLKK